MEQEELKDVFSFPLFADMVDTIEIEEESISIKKVDLDVEIIPLSVFIEELKDDSYEVRHNCLSRLRAVALSVGLQNFRESLLPNLIEILGNKESLLAILAEQLGQMVFYIGGSEYIPLLLGKLELLAAWDNIEIQERAIKSLIFLIDYIDEFQIKKFFLPMILRLARDDYNIVCRSSACQLLVAIYGRTPLEFRSFLKSLIIFFGIDSSPLVRHDIARNLGVLAELMQKSSVISCLLPLHQYLCNDAMEYIKIAALENTPAISEKLDSETREKYILDVIKNAIEDQSIEVRKVITGKMCEFLSVFHSDESRKFFVTGFNSLIFDCDTDLRAQAILESEEFLGKLALGDRMHLLEDMILPNMKDLLSCQNYLVRKSIASVICGYAKLISKERIATDLYPVFHKLFHDSSSKVRAEIVTQFYKLFKIIPVDDIQAKFLPSLMVLGGDSDWNVRLASIDFHKKFSMNLGFEFFDTVYCNIFLKWLSDKVFVIREKCVQALGAVIKRFGYQSQESFIPRALVLTKSSNYLLRITCVNLLMVLAPLCSKDVNVQIVLPALLKLAQDPVANVRFNVAKAYKTMYPELDDRYASLFIKPSLFELTFDKDHDVRYFATDALDFVDSSGTPQEITDEDFVA